jgi:NAD(P)-dependent dehydrogenase (short-subunit alcohol dehydrogenase family)
MLNRLTGSAEKKAAFYAAVPLKRGGKVAEIADAIIFVASDRAASSPARSSASTAARLPTEYNERKERRS